MRKLILSIFSVFACFSVWSQSIESENALVDAVTLYETGKLDEALEQFQRIHAADSTNDAAYYYMGMCEYALGHQEKAAEMLKKAVSMDGDNSWYRNSLASVYLNMGLTQEAAPLLKKLVEEFPQAYNNPYMLTLLGDSELRQYKDSLALGWYDRALEIDPSYAPAEMSKAELYRMRGNNPAFFVSLEKVIRNSEVIPEAKSKYLESMMERMDPKFWWVWGEQICSLIDVCVEMHPEDMGSRWLKVNTCAIKEDWDGAISQCRDIADVSKAKGDRENFSKAYSTIGDILHENKADERGAFAMYDLALKADPENAAVLNNYAYYLSLKGKNLRKALKMSKITIEKEPDNATYLDTYGWILHLLRKDAESKPYFKHALIYGGRESKVILEHYSEVLKALNEEDLAEYYARLAKDKQ